MILRFGVHGQKDLNNVTLSCAMTASPATILINVSGHFYEYTLKGEVKDTDGQDVPDAEMLKKVSHV